MTGRYDPAPAHAVLARATAAGGIVGTVLAVAHRGTRYLHAAGLEDREAGAPMRADTPFRLASLTKAVVSVAALALVERGSITLDEPVTRWLPWFTPSLAGGERPAITLRHLATHTAGLAYGFALPDGADYRTAGISDGLDQSGLTLEENLRRLASVPLRYTPGTNWSYSLATDVLGAVLEQASGRPLPELIERLVAGPLGTSSFVFVAPRESALATPYADAAPLPVRMPANHTLSLGGSAIRYAPARAWDATAFPSGGTGLIGTANDYLQFLEAIRSGGAPILKAASAAAFVTNATGDLTVGLPGSGLGWSLGVAIVRDPAASASPLSPGSWQWGGVYGHHYWVDPAAELSAVLLTNTALAGMAGPFPDAVKRAVHAGIGRPG